MQLILPHKNIAKQQIFNCSNVIFGLARIQTFLSSDKRDPCRAINTWSTTFDSLARKKNLWNFTRHEKDFFPRSHEIFRSIWSQVKLSATSNSSLSLKMNLSICFYVYLVVNWVWQSIRADNESRLGFADCTCATIWWNVQTIWKAHFQQGRCVLSSGKSLIRIRMDRKYWNLCRKH